MFCKALRSISFRKKTAWTLMWVMIAELACPALSFAITSGPVQPEAQSFEPVGTTDMVDLFTGDFVYNIPLMDVEGYPLNISYHGGVGMEQEASWVGLGWNINPGAVNRAIRGLPDDFKGEMIEKEFYMKPDETIKVGTDVSAELFGLSKPKINVSASLGGYLTINNYRGMSVDFSAGVAANAGLNFGPVFLGTGTNIGVGIGSQSGASIDYNKNIGIGMTATANGDLSVGGSFNINSGGVYSPRMGLKRNVGMSVGVNLSRETSSGSATSRFSTGTAVPIGLQNYTVAVANPYYTSSISGQLKLGGELWGIYLHGSISGSYQKTEFEQAGHRKSYGYFNLPYGTDSSLLDFSREKDGMWNPTMINLGLSHLTYDVYSVSGQGTGGSFRPFRNDIGSVFDPASGSTSEGTNVGLEVGLGNFIEVAGEVVTSGSTIASGPWLQYKRGFKEPRTGSFEDVYFKEGGELTENNETYLNGIGNETPLTPDEALGLPLEKPGAGKRVVRANYIYALTGSNLDTSMLLDSKELISYKDHATVDKEIIPRVGGGSESLGRKAHHVTEIIQTQKDGRRYIYGLPVINNVQREATFAVNPAKVNSQAWEEYLVDYQPGVEDKVKNGFGVDEFYSSSVTPSYVSAYLLTGVLSSDYVDVSGDGITDDDLGTYTKFNYSRKSTDYRWRSPGASGKAQFIPSYISDKRDDKAAYIIGSRENWMLHSVETKNYIAEFHTSVREDARGVEDAILGNGTSAYYTDNLYKAPGTALENKSYKLDSIVLYNKHDRFTKGANATPIKSVHFTYDYSLCQGVPNSSSGKLTLKKIQIRFGRSNINMSASYDFTYTNNYNYNAANKDRWGFYKPSDPNYNNFEFPYTSQSLATDEYAKAWSLSRISLPSGGIISVDYEADDYAFVQDQNAMEMFKIFGFGNTANSQEGNQMYFNVNQPNLYLYFERRGSDENDALSFRDNYLKGTNLIYYNVPAELTTGKYEPIKGYAEVQEIGICNNDTTKGYIKLKGQRLTGNSTITNPIVVTALNVGRYSLPHIMYPGHDHTSSDMVNVMAGLKEAIKELFKIRENPLKSYIDEGRAKKAQLSKSYIRLTSPGLRKKGGGQRVKSIKFYDNWSAMANGNEAIYGKQYAYTIPLDNGKGIVSSGVASWEPAIGGDELPQRAPDYYTAQAGNNFPPNDPIDLYQEMPLGETFYPAPVVGYRKITVRSINVDKGRSSQSEDISYFYTAKDFPVKFSKTPITHVPDSSISITEVHFKHTVKQGYSLVLNDMHGKLHSSEHWVILTDPEGEGRKLVNFTTNEYLTQGGQITNTVPVYKYSPSEGKMTLEQSRMGLETDITIDSRIKEESSATSQMSVNVNSFFITPLPIPIIIPLAVPFQMKNSLTFKQATVTKVTQQYGILSKVTTSNEGANTELRNEVFDRHTGNALVTSMNNEFTDRQYSVNYPAYWAYKELGPVYENQNMWEFTMNSIAIDTFGEYADRFINYNPYYSTRYKLPSNMPVGRTIVDEAMPQYKLGDELLIYPLSLAQKPIRVWVMGYTSDTNHCYAVLATRKPYQPEDIWDIGNTIEAGTTYRVARSGNKNRLGEVIQTFTTTDPNNVLPGLKNDLTGLISLTAQRYNHVLDQVYAENTISDSLNPFVTGKVGMYRKSQDIINLKKRSYSSNTTRDAGVFDSKSYWQIEKDRFHFYCADSTFLCPIFDSIKFSNAGSSTLRLDLVPFSTKECDEPARLTVMNPVGDTVEFFPLSIEDPATLYIPFSEGALNSDPCYFNITVSSNCYCRAILNVTYTNGHFYIDYLTPYWPPGTYSTLTGYSSIDVYTGYTPGGTLTPYRATRKIELGQVGHYDGTDNENWVSTAQATKYNWFGQEIESKEEGLGYNSVVYGYDQQLPICVARNARHGEALFEGLEDYKLLRPAPIDWMSYRQLYYSPVAPLMQPVSGIAERPYEVSTMQPIAGYNFEISNTEAHTGYYSLKANRDVSLSLNGEMAGMADGYSFKMKGNQKYVASVWLRQITPSEAALLDGSYKGTVTIDMDTTFGSASSMYQTVELVPSTNIIDGWQQYEMTFDAPADYKSFVMKLKGGFYYDDLRIYPFESNIKGFVYHAVTRKLIAILDENNFATFYEYDDEGNLVRTKKETEQGVLTVSETRSTHQKTNKN